MALALLALILYGSLYPFVFQRVTVPANLLAALWTTARFPANRGDVVSNILLYLPLAFFAVRAFPRISPVALAVLAAIAGAILSTSIELAQFYDYGRNPNFYDAAANTTGAALGGVAGVAVRRVSTAMLLLAAWFGSRLVPFLPSFSLHKYTLALRLFFTPVDVLDFFRYFTLWLVAAALIPSVFEKQRSGRILLCGIFLVFAARIVLVDTLLTASEVAGAIAAATVWIGFLSRLEPRAKVVCAILAAFIAVFIAIDALRPFHFNPAPRHFGLVPFRSFMDGPRENGSRVFLEKTFIYGSLLWLLRRSGISLALATVLALALVLPSRLAQVYLPGRSAEITDALMVLMFAGLMALLPE